MYLERKAAYYSYMHDLFKMGVANPSNCHTELMRKFPELDKNNTERLVNMYIREEMENRRTFLIE
jgi:glutamyl/glutaminyl-tRNA synthetase